MCTWTKTKQGFLSFSYDSLSTTELLDTHVACNILEQSHVFLYDVG